MPEFNRETHFKQLQDQAQQKMLSKQAEANHDLTQDQASESIDQGDSLVDEKLEQQHAIAHFNVE